ncbi:MAG: DNA translocase FtsK 4TM domain-containing protein [Bdellovibrionales bacterium]|nr:DNA translocase FtsK 4TM domain-containing protein [Bdellovibrionales bacterium]
MSWSKKIKEKTKKNRLKAFFILAFLIFLSLSLYSYHPQDTSLNSVGFSLKVSNYCGFVGATLADFIYQFFGFLGAWLIVLTTLGVVCKLFLQPLSENYLSHFIVFIVFLFSFVSLAALHFPLVSFYNQEISLAGFFGLKFVSIFKPFFGTIGTGIILWSIFIVFFILYGQFLYPLLLRFPKKLLISLFLFTKQKGNSLKFLFRFGYKHFFKLGLVKFLKKIKKQFKSVFRFFRLKKNFKKKDKNLNLGLQKTVFDEKKEISSKDSLNLNSLSIKKSALGDEFSIKENSDSDLKLNPLKEKNSKPSFAVLNKPDSFDVRQLPSINLLSDPPSVSKKISSQEVEELSKKLLDKLKQFSIEGQIKAIKTGPALVLFEYKPENHVKVSQIKNMESDLSLALSSESVRIIAPIPGRDVIGIEASMPFREMVYLKTLLQEEDFSKITLPLVLGRRADNKVGIKDLARIPHLLVAGTTGSGKSMFIISFICSLLFRHTPDNLKFLLIDPKQVDLSSFKGIPHLLAPIIHSVSSAIQSLHWAIQEMEKRYRSLAEFKVRDHKSFNQVVTKLSQKEKDFHEQKSQEIEDTYYFQKIPLITIVIEEFGDLMADPTARRPIENAVVRLAQKARASGIHLVLAMQSPRKDVVTGLIKTNIPGRISFKVASGTDSRIILDDMGAERLLSHGDMLFLEPGSLKAARYHGPFMRDREVSAIASYWRDLSESFYEENLMEILNKGETQQSSFKGHSLKKDSMYNEILDFVKTCDVISASLLQRKFQIGYPRAGRIIQDLFDKGEIGPPRGSKPRLVLNKKNKSSREVENPRF